MRSTIVCPGEKPSEALYGPGAIGTPFALRGICAGFSASRRPVGDVLSARVYASLGHGSRLPPAADALDGARSRTARTTVPARRTQARPTRRAYTNVTAASRRW